NSAGKEVSFADIIRYELNQPIARCKVCGGTHRLFGLSWAYHLHRAAGGKKEGIWKDVAATTEKFKDLARQYQNKDGAFSTKAFEGPERIWKTQVRLATTGHIVEWLALALKDDELKEQWVQNAVYALCQMILENRDNGLDGGTLYHAAHGLAIYRARVFGPEKGSLSPVIPLPPRD